MISKSLLIVTDSLYASVGYFENEKATRVWIISFFALAAVALHGLLLLGFSSDLTLASIDIAKAPTAINIRWAVEAPVPVSVKTSSATSASTKRLIHQQKSHKNIASSKSAVFSKPSLTTAANTHTEGARHQPDMALPEENPQPVRKKELQRDVPRIPLPDAQPQKTKTKTLTQAKRKSSRPPETSNANMQSLASKGSQQAQTLSGRKPTYPRNAIRRQQEGRVLVGLSLDKEGHVTKVELVKTSGYYLLDQAVIKFVKRERFNPATLNGSPTASQQEFGFVFSLL